MSIIFSRINEKTNDCCYVDRILFAQRVASTAHFDANAVI